jgi:plastocyanin
MYTDNGFIPSTLTIKKGDTVTWVNNSTGMMRVASDPHPLHNGYPTKGGCVSSTFDECAVTGSGGTFSFKFDIVGTWGYHNHAVPSDKGTIVVQ